MPIRGTHLFELLSTFKHNQEQLQDKEMEQCCLTEAMQRQRLETLSETIIALCEQTRGFRYKYKLNFAEQCQKPDPWDPSSTAPFDIRIGLQLERHQRECYDKMCCEPQILYSVSDNIICQRRSALPLSTEQKMNLAEELHRKLVRRARKHKAPPSGKSKFGNNVTNQDQQNEQGDAHFLPHPQAVRWWELKTADPQTSDSHSMSSNTSGSGVVTF